MAGSTGGARDDDFDRAWEAITKELGDLQPAPPPEPSEPSEDEPTRDERSHTWSSGDVPVRDEPSRTGPAGGDDADDAVAGWGDRADLGLGGPRDYEPVEEEGFVPPEPELIRTDRRPLLALGWVLLSLSAATLLVCAVVRTIPVLVAQLAGGGMLLAFGVLLSQLPKGRHDEDDPDKGAIV